MPTAQASPRVVSLCRKGALRPYPASASTQPKRTPAAITRSISASAISGLVRAARYSTGTPARFKRTGLLVQLSGTKRRNATITGTSPRAQCLAIGRLAERRGILRSNTNRTIALLRHRRVVDDQHRILAADQAIGLNQQFRLQWRCVPNAISNEMVQLVILARCQSRRHRLDALAITRSNQSRDIKRTHPSPCLVA